MAAAEAFVASMGNFTMMAVVTVAVVAVTVMTADSLAFVETDDRGLAMASWNSFVPLESDTSSSSAAGETSVDEFSTKASESVAFGSKSVTGAMEAGSGTTVTASASVNSCIATANTIKTFDAMSEVETASLLLMAEATEATKVLIGTHITESAKAIVDTFTASKSRESWSVVDVGLDAFEA